MQPSQDDAKQALHAHLAKGLPYADEEQLNQVVGLLTGEVEPESIEGTAAWVRLCYNRPNDEALFHHALNEVLECHGVECIKKETIQVFMGNDEDLEAIYEEHEADIEFEYLNTGDCYDGTLVFDGNAIYVTSWGDMLEALEQEIADSANDRDWSKERISNPHPMPTDIQPMIDAASGVPAPVVEALAPAPASITETSQGSDYTPTPGPGM